MKQTVMVGRMVAVQTWTGSETDDCRRILNQSTSPCQKISTKLEVSNGNCTLGTRVKWALSWSLAVSKCNHRRSRRRKEALSDKSEKILFPWSWWCWKRLRKLRNVAYGSHQSHEQCRLHKAEDSLSFSSWTSYARENEPINSELHQHRLTGDGATWGLHTESVRAAGKRRRRRWNAVKLVPSNYDKTIESPEVNLFLKYRKQWLWCDCFCTFSWKELSVCLRIVAKFLWKNTHTQRHTPKNGLNSAHIKWQSIQGSSLQVRSLSRKRQMFSMFKSSSIN